MNKTETLISRFMWISLCIMLVSFFMKDSLSPPNILTSSILKAPVQTPTTIPPFTVNKGGVLYTITPLYEYTISGLVVSEHNTNSFLDYYHKRWGDTLNVKDICVIWGNNATSGVYQSFSFKNGSWTCYYKTKSSKAFATFTENELSNNHLLAASDTVTKTLTSIQKGDQVRISGYLAEYTHDGGFKRGTSVTRTDRGNGACETIFVTRAEIIQRANEEWYTVFYISYWIFIGSLLLKIILFFHTMNRAGKPVKTMNKKEFYKEPEQLPRV